MGFFSKLFGKNEEKFDPNHLYAPMAGAAVPVTEVPDPTFAEGLLGDGIAIIPTDGKVYAPCDATVEMMFTTGHAVSLSNAAGAEILIHVGLETVGLEGKPFKVHVASGDKVKKGQLLMEADLEAIKAAGLDCKVIIGGAPVSAEACKNIGADEWAHSPQKTVATCKAWAN